MKQVVILGEKGNLSKSLTKKFPEAIVIPRHQYLSWMGSPGEVSNFFLNLKISDEIPDVYNCAGITNPSIESSVINHVNYMLPVFLSKLSVVMNFRLITLGTVMELLPKYSVSNPYLESKLKFYTKYVSNDNWQSRNLHFQMHTLYGGSQIHRHMFIGQIYDSIKSKSIFRMSGGDQIREYHHIDDVTEAILQLTKTASGGLIDISHGKPEKLKDIATIIFEHFGSRDLLRIATKIADENDNKDMVFKRTANLSDSLFRPTIGNLIKWLERLGASRENQR
jgi:hypothetical protein